MSVVTKPNQDSRSKQIMTSVREIALKLTNKEKRPWHLEAAISFTIALLGTAVWLASAQVI